jgi:ATP-dependent 26S proteasome regulatory subunit
VFKSAETLGGAILFFDELDALGGNRERGDVHEVSRRMLSVMLR